MVRYQALNNELSKIEKELQTLELQIQLFGQREDARSKGRVEELKKKAEGLKLRRSDLQGKLIRFELSKIQGSLADLIALGEILGERGLELALQQLAPQLNQEQRQWIIEALKENWIDGDLVKLSALDLSKVGGKTREALEGSLAKALANATEYPQAQERLRSIGAFASLSDDLLGKAPEKTGLDEYTKQVVNVENWVRMYREATPARRKALRVGLRTRPSSQQGLGKMLIDLGESGQPSLSLKEVHQVLVAKESKFRSIESMMDSGLIDPQMPLQPSQGAVPDQLSEPASSIEHERSA
jgi:hypothetical protein